MSKAGSPLHSESQIIRFESQEPTHFVRLPRMARIDLNPYELALYSAYKDAGNESEKTNAELASETQMSITKLKEARAALQSKGYIHLERRLSDSGHDFAPPIVTIINVWAENERRYGGSRDATGGSRHTTPPLSPHDTPPVKLEGGSRDTTPPAASVIPERKIEGNPPVVASLDSAGAQARADSIQDSKTLDQEKDQEKKERDKKIKDSREAWMKAIVKLFPHIREDAYAYAGKYIAFFQGKTPKEQGGEWDKWKVDNSETPITAVHVFAFGHWWHATHRDMTIRKCQTIHDYFEEFMALENLPGRLLNAEKQLAKALNLPEIQTVTVVTSPEVKAEIEDMRAQMIQMARLSGERPAIYG